MKWLCSCCLCKWISTICNTLRCHYNVIQYSIILHPSLQWLRQIINQNLNTQKTSHILPSRVSYGVSFEMIFEKTVHVITALYCILMSRNYIKIHMEVHIYVSPRHSAPNELMDACKPIGVTSSSTTHHLILKTNWNIWFSLIYDLGKFAAVMPSINLNRFYFFNKGKYTQYTDTFNYHIITQLIKTLV